MYTSLLLITLAWVLANPFPFRMILWVGLVVTLWVKLSYEEQLLLARFPSYAEYRLRTKRIVPFLSILTRCFRKLYFLPGVVPVAGGPVVSAKGPKTINALSSLIIRDERKP